MNVSKHLQVISSSFVIHFTDPPPSNFAVSQRKGNEVIIKWSNPVACYEIQGVTMFVDGSKRRIDSHEVLDEITLNRLQPETDYTFTVKLNYEGDKSSPVYNYAFNTGPCAPDEPDCKHANQFA
jgi:hypothetical protein